MERRKAGKTVTASSELARRERGFVLTYSLLQTLLAMGFSIGFWAAGQYAVGATFNVLALLLFNSQRAVREGRSIRPIAHLVTATTIALLMSASTIGGGAQGTTLGFLAFPVFLAVYLLGPLAGALWTAVACLGVVVMATLERSYDFTPDLEGAPLALNNGAIIIVALWISLLLGRRYHKRRTAHLAALREATETRKLLGELSTLGRDVEAAAAEVGLTNQLEDTAFRVQDTHRQVAERANQLLDTYQTFGKSLVGVADQMATIHKIVAATDAVDEGLALAALNAALQAGKTGVVAFRLIANEVGRVSADALSLVRDIKRDSIATETRLQSLVSLAKAAVDTAESSREELAGLSQVFRQLTSDSTKVQDEASSLRHVTQARLELLVGRLQLGDPLEDHRNNTNDLDEQAPRGPLVRYSQWATESLSDFDERLRARLIVTFCLGLACAALGVASVVISQSSTSGVALFATGAAMLLWPQVLRWTGSLTLAASGVCGGYIILVAASAILSGGIFGVTLPALLIIPFAAVFWTRDKAAIGWTFLASTVVAGFAVAQAVGIEVSTGGMPQDIGQLINPAAIMANLWLCWLLASAHVRHSNELEARLASIDSFQEAANDVSELAVALQGKLSNFSESDGAAAALNRQVDYAVTRARAAESHLERVNDSIDELDELDEQLITDGAGFKQYGTRLKKIRRRLEVVRLEASLQAVSQKDSRLLVVADELQRVITQSGEELLQVDVASAHLRANLRQISLPRKLREQASDSLDILYAGRHQLDAMTHLSHQLETVGSAFVTTTQRHLDGVGAVMDTTLANLRVVFSKE